jgi:predicted HAD superfamily Cof-like phosphohydrolase
LTPLQMVRQFHEAFGVPAYDTPRIPPDNRVNLRVDLIDEEWNETGDAIESEDLVEIADGLADLVVVIYGTALEYGIDLDAVLEEVHASNMAKLGADGKPILRADGKVLKPEGWKPPNIAAVLGL